MSVQLSISALPLLHRSPPSQQAENINGRYRLIEPPRRPEIAPTQKPCLVLVPSVRAPIARLHVAVATTVDVHPQVTLAIFAGRSPPNPFIGVHITVVIGT